MKTKEIKFGVRTEKHDFDVKIKAIQRFLEEGDRVHVVMQMRGREQAHPNIAFTKLALVVTEVGELGKVMTPAKQDGRNVHLTLVPAKPTKGKPKPKCVGYEPYSRVCSDCRNCDGTPGSHR